PARPHRMDIRRATGRRWRGGSAGAVGAGPWRGAALHRRLQGCDGTDQHVCHPACKRPARGPGPGNQPALQRERGKRDERKHQHAGRGGERPVRVCRHLQAGSLTVNLTLRDFASMRLPMAVLAVVLVASFAMVKTTSLRHDTAAAQLRAQERPLLEARQRVERSGLEREAILTHLPAYRKLEEEGLVGPEQRIEWIESLRTADKQAG